MAPPRALSLSEGQQTLVAVDHALMTRSRIPTPDDIYRIDRIDLIDLIDRGQMLA
ncbi:hypothetical protein [Pandoraea anhela]|uniref:Uncharacterized protein n=1 Tax=Pandoraea anhela TaxID=2508295 RepID=A0A5E4T6H7_9BURK|nr:hypothetical protein [Pandoraea anhela]VVD83730.1 hypothetical protein PAN31108_01247 [Pandoraea anhela]